MPVIRTTLIEGYEEATKKRLAERLTDTVRATIAAPLDGITVILEEVAPSSYMRGRSARTPGKPVASAADTVRAFLAAMEARDLETARGFLADGFAMTFPGNARFSRLEELVEWGRARYKFVRKTYDAFEEAFGETGMVVYCHGTLAGEWPDGTAFSGIRFIDRFEVADGKLTDQRVWNDLAEMRSGMSST
jgi:phenylpyruvate tautomerase PptA (4-oxalocrotonate tautomerase family)